MAKRHIFGNKSTVRPWVDRALRQDFPPIRIVEVEESSDSSETSKEEMQETTRATDVEMKDSSPSMAARDTNMENESKEEEQSMDIEGQEGYSDDDTVPQWTKDSTNGKSMTHQSTAQHRAPSNQRTSNFTWICTSTSQRLQKKRDHLKSLQR
jgi:hypothetical protein